MSDFQWGVLLELLQRNESCAGVTNKDVVVVGLENICAGEKVCSHICALVGATFIFGILGARYSSEDDSSGSSLTSCVGEV